MTSLSTARPPTARPAAAAAAPASTPWRRVGLAVASVGWGANQFAPMLLAYERHAGVSTATADATFALYAIGLAPGLLVGGPLSDRFGRRPLLLAGLVASLLASAVLAAAGGDVALLFAGRLVAGIASGVAFSAGAAWIRELSGPAGARRATVAMTAGFAGGPLVAGLLAQFAGDPLVVPYLPHIALVLVALVGLVAPAAGRRPAAGGRPAPGDLGPTVERRLPTDHRPPAAPDSAPVARRPDAPAGAGHDGGEARAAGPGLWRDPRFWLIVVPLAPWVFGAAAVALAFLPAVVADRVGDGALVFGAGVASAGALAGIVVQPIARRLSRAGLVAVSLGSVCASLVLAAVAAGAGSPVLVAIAGLALGGGYGLCQVAGLEEIQRIAPPERLAGSTAVYQSLSYVGFGLPFLLAAVPVAPRTELLVLAGLAAVTVAVCGTAARRLG